MRDRDTKKHIEPVQALQHKRKVHRGPPELVFGHEVQLALTHKGPEPFAHGICACGAERSSDRIDCAWGAGFDEGVKQVAQLAVAKQPQRVVLRTMSNEREGKLEL
eukprot:Amastigsp_a681567_3.p3 type:complete len:106 gc:universal Amastigsp_a681567_3:227-544(+)